MLWLAAYLTGFPPVGLHALSWTHGLAPMWSGLYLISTLHLMESTLNGQEHTVSMPSRAYTSFLPNRTVNVSGSKLTVSMPSRAYTSFLLIEFHVSSSQILVSMPSRAYTSFLRKSTVAITSADATCQCPLGLIPHFYYEGNEYEARLEWSKCQCPLGLIPHFYHQFFVRIWRYVHLCQCPLGLIPHFYGTPSKT